MRLSSIRFLSSLAIFLIANDASGQATSARLVWPQPPDTARIEYVGEWRTDRDVDSKPARSFLSRVWEVIVGRDDRDQLAVNRPFDVYVDEAGLVYLSNGANPGILVLDPSDGDSRQLRPGGDAMLAKPMGIGGDGSGTIFVADPVQRRVVAITAEGEFVRAYGGRNVLLNPTDVAVGPRGERVYVADSYLHQVVIFDRSTGEVLRRVGRDLDDIARARTGESSDLARNRGSAPGEFSYPAFVATDASGRVFVCDGLNFRIQILDRDGEFMSEFGRLGDTPGSFARPKGLAVGSDGSIHVVDAAYNNVQVFDDKGRLLLAYAGLGTARGELWLPMGIAIDSSDGIYVADRYNNRIQLFRRLSPERAD